MKSKVKRYIERYNMLPKGSTVIVGLSGGADSIALTHFLHTQCQEYDVRVIAAHVNHSIRASANDDENFARNFCAKYNIPFYHLRADVPRISREEKSNIEDAARRVRYNFFRSIDPNAKIATAHTLNDQAETVLFRLIRGTGLKGLTGIPPVRDAIIRPFLECTRAEIESYCKAFGLTYVTDETNEDTSYARNFLRHEVLPLLKEINPSFLGSIRRSTQVLTQDNDTLDDLAEMVYHKAMREEGFSVLELQKAPLAIRKRVIAQILYDEIQVMPEYIHIENVNALIERGSGTVQVLQDTMLRIRNGILEFPGQDYCDEWEMEVIMGRMSIPSGVLDINLYNQSEFITKQKIYKNTLAIYFDYDKIKGKMQVRSRKAGDSFIPAHFSATKKVKKMLSEMHVAPEKRNLVPVFSDDLGVIGMAGIGPDRRVAITESTKRILLIDFGGIELG